MLHIEVSMGLLKSSLWRSIDLNFGIMMLTLPIRVTFEDELWAAGQGRAAFFHGALAQLLGPLVSYLLDIIPQLGKSLFNTRLELPLNQVLKFALFLSYSSGLLLNPCEEGDNLLHEIYLYFTQGIIVSKHGFCGCRNATILLVYLIGRCLDCLLRG